jgi:D-3-phosphoglycerate dehydrogenase
MTIAGMKTDSMLINTSRGPIVEEGALADALLQGHLGGAALDVFEKEPYEGVLTKLDNVVLTAHMGASARESRYLMELGAAEDCLRFLNDEPLANPVPESEFDESNVPLASLKG